MFNAAIYEKRRSDLISQFKEGVLLFLANGEVPMNYPANTYRFRQDSTFLYYFGLDIPDLAVIIDIDKNEVIIYGDEPNMDDIIWMGDKPGVKELSKRVGIEVTKPFEKLAGDLCKSIGKGRKVHYLPPYHEEKKKLTAFLLDLKYQEIDKYVSVDLIKAVVKQRAVKKEEEIMEMESTLSEVTFDMHVTAMKMANEGVYEYQIAGAIKGIMLQKNRMLPYPVICTVHGETLHNNNYDNKLKKEQVLLVDAGSESILHYATDITRTTPVGRKFSNRQKEIYTIVLESQLKAIDLIKPGTDYKSIHLEAAGIMAEGLKQTGIIKGNIDDVVAQGAHALFFPHGLGHLIGLDVHDMENLGEDYVGYDEKVLRSMQFGLAYLRYGKILQQGNVITVEPGIYFIPALIEQWKADKKFSDFIDYSKLEKYMDFGGIRIEDNILVTDKGHRILGKPIPKSIDEIENIA
ncbi:MAG: aminopeptidase P family protein [Bacteroidales bacterium]|nr:aminopeptidase P family protein [Bacteroidales bacterium]